MSVDEQKIRSEVRRSLEAIGDAAAPARPFEEIGVPPSGTGSDRSTRPQRVLAVAGSLAVLSVLVVGLLVVRSNRDDTSPTGVPATDDIGTATSVSSTGSVAASAPPTTEPADQGAPTPTADTAATTSAPDSGPTLDEVRAAQVEALRRLPGFTATSIRTNFTPGTDQVESEQTAQVTLLPDGSFYADRGADGWGSFDPATHVVRGAFTMPDGTMGYQEIVGQVTNTVPLGVLTGHDPTTLVRHVAPAATTVRETTFEDRAVWEVTTVYEFDSSMCEGGCSSPPSTQTTVQSVDQETGLVIRNSVTSGAPNTIPSLSVLRDVRIVEQMPPEFPGSFPSDVTVDRSGDPNGATTIPYTDIAGRFGIPVPLPVGFESSTISYQEMNGAAMESEEGQTTTLYRSAVFSVPDGFTATTVVVSANAVPPGGATPTGMIVVDGGYVCGSADGDDECDAVDAATMSSRQTDEPVTLTSGAFAGLVAFPDEGSMSITSGPFQITVLTDDRAAALAIANDFVVVQP